MQQEPEPPPQPPEPTPQPPSPPPQPLPDTTRDTPLPEHVEPTEPWPRR